MTNWLFFPIIPPKKMEEEVAKPVFNQFIYYQKNIHPFLCIKWTEPNMKTILILNFSL